MRTDSFGNTHSSEPQSPPWDDIDPWSVPTFEPSILEPVLAEGDQLLLTGSAGAGKSSLLCSILLGFVQPELAGQTAGGALVPNHALLGDRFVGLIDSENTLGRWATMIRNYLEHAGIDRAMHNRRVRRYSPQVLPVAAAAPDPEVIRRAVKELADSGVGLLAIDSMIPQFRPSEPNSSTWVTERLNPFRWACQEFKVTCMIVCHVARSSASGSSDSPVPYGSGQQEATADTVLHLSRSGDGGAALRLLKARRSPWLTSGRTVPLTLLGNSHFKASNARDHWPLAPDQRPLDPLTPRQREVLEALRACGEAGATSAELASKFNIAPDTLGEHLDAARKLGLARLTFAGPNSRWFAELTEGRE